MNRKLIKFEKVVKNMRDNSKKKWYCKYQNITRDYFNEDFELTNREVREALQEIKGYGIKDNNAYMDLYLIGINANKKDGNPDRAMIEEGIMLTVKHLILLVFLKELNKGALSVLYC
jgi:hypothetical protein